MGEDRKRASVPGMRSKPDELDKQASETHVPMTILCRAIKKQQHINSRWCSTMLTLARAHTPAQSSGLVRLHPASSRLPVASSRFERAGLWCRSMRLPTQSRTTHSALRVRVRALQARGAALDVPPQQRRSFLCTVHTAIRVLVRPLQAGRDGRLSAPLNGCQWLSPLNLSPRDWPRGSVQHEMGRSTS